MAGDRLDYEGKLFTDEEEAQALSFEAGIRNLEQVVKALEERDVPLEKALSLFKAGIGLVQHCTKLLDQAEQEMQVLLEEDGKLQVKTAAFPLEGESYSV